MIKYYKTRNPHTGELTGIRKAVRMETSGPEVIAIIGQVGELIDLDIITPTCLHSPENDREHWLVIPADGRVPREYRDLVSAKKGVLDL